MRLSLSLSLSACVSLSLSVYRGGTDTSNGQGDVITTQEVLRQPLHLAGEGCGKEQGLPVLRLCVCVCVCMERGREQGRETV